METQAIENIPARAYRARETLTLPGEQLVEVFEIAEPGADFQPYSRNELARSA